MNVAEPLFLTRDQIEKLHRNSLAAFGGLEGVRNESLTDSALASAKNTYWYGGDDLFEIAAAYAFHLAEAQGFLDGNKRTAIGAALTFLELNGISSVPDDTELYDAMIAIADKKLNKSGLAAMFRAAFERPAQ
ncbi:Death-on-curing family protein [Verrucomicrobia bacterium]|nr:Death-on-curing family protein [Verrucomicrobiota bacterium]